jgi:ubiquitin C-terminal hydrolase
MGEDSDNNTISVSIDELIRQKNSSGLANLGATCYINTIVQCLSYCPTFLKYVLFGKRLKRTSTPLTEQLQEVYKELWINGNAIAPRGFLMSLQQSLGSYINIFEQNDACEFLMLYLDKLNADLAIELLVDIDEVNEVTENVQHIDNQLYRSLVVDMKRQWLTTIKKEYSPITEIFYGQLISQIVCGNCNHVHHNYETYCNLSLSIKGDTLDSCLGDFFQQETLNKKEKDWTCDKCNICAPSQKTMRLWKNPHVLIVSLKRFDHNLNKNTTDVNAPVVLELSPFCLHTEMQSYELVAVAHHMGSVGSGHYNCICKHPNGTWYAIDDQLVREAQLKEVEYVIKNGYIYFYEHKAQEHV